MILSPRLKIFMNLFYEGRRTSKWPNHAQRYAPPGVAYCGAVRVACAARWPSAEG